jgi:hypothetical protein
MTEKEFIPKLEELRQETILQINAFWEKVNRLADGSKTRKLIRNQMITKLKKYQRCSLIINFHKGKKIEDSDEKFYKGINKKVLTDPIFDNENFRMGEVTDEFVMQMVKAENCKDANHALMLLDNAEESLQFRDYNNYYISKGR